MIDAKGIMGFLSATERLVRPLSLLGMDLRSERQYCCSRLVGCLPTQVVLGYMFGRGNMSRLVTRLKIVCFFSQKREGPTLKQYIPMPPTPRITAGASPTLHGLVAMQETQSVTHTMVV